MKLVASLIIHNELARYLEPCIAHLLDFCDEVCVVDSASTDQSQYHLRSMKRVAFWRLAHNCFYEHEGQARQNLIDFTLAQSPTHVLSIDADELISDGAALRARLEAEPDQPVWQLNIEEIWTANEHLFAREDGGWRTHGVPFLWKAPPAGQRWTMRDRKLACGRIPTQVVQQGGRAKPVGVSLLHFGWTDPATRQARYDRYTKHDGGRFHASRHLQSILWADSRVKLRQRPWPEGAVFDELRTRFTVTV